MCRFKLGALKITKFHFSFLLINLGPSRKIVGQIRVFLVLGIGVTLCHWKPPLPPPLVPNPRYVPGAPQEGSGLRDTDEGLTERSRALQDESGSRGTNQGPAERIRARGTDQAPMDEPGPRKTNQGAAGRIRAQQDVPGSRKTNQSPM